MDKAAIAASVIDELEVCLAKLEQLDALVAAAHLDAAITTLCDEFDISRGFSVPD